MEVLARPAYRPLWVAARRRVEANGLSLDGTPLVLKELTPPEADAIAGLLGVRRPPLGAPFRVSLTRLDQSLRASSVACGLLDVLTALNGPLVDRRATRMSDVASRAWKWNRLIAHPVLERDPRLAGWLDHVRNTGLDRRLAGTDGVAAVRIALDIIAVLFADDRQHRLAVLAADVVGDSHGLDRGRAAGTLVVSALSWLRGAPFPRDAADWRRVWADAGVACDDLSCDVLVLNLPGFPAEPLRLTLRQVMAWQPGCSSRRVVFACENPAVVAAAADHAAGVCPPLVCVDGMPSTAALMVLRRLSAERNVVRYHGDFDWHGLAIARVMFRKLPSALPWRYGVDDYRRSVGAGLGIMQLTGRTATSPWNPELAPAMQSAGVAVYEEQVIDELVDDLERAEGARASSRHT